MRLCFLKTKDEIFSSFCEWKKQVENQADRKVKYLRTDISYVTKPLIRSVGSKASQSIVLVQESKHNKPKSNIEQSIGNTYIILSKTFTVDIVR